MSKTKQNYIVGCFIEAYLEMPGTISAYTEDEAKEIAISKSAVMKCVKEDIVQWDIVSEEQLVFDFHKDIKETFDEEND